MSNQTFPSLAKLCPTATNADATSSGDADGAGVEQTVFEWAAELKARAKRQIRIMEGLVEESQLEVHHYETLATQIEDVIVELQNYEGDTHLAMLDALNTRLEMMNELCDLNRAADKYYHYR